MASHRILVVDDVADIRLFVKATLAPEGFEIIEAANGVKAIELFHSENPSLIILDLSIGQPDGFEVCREIRKTSAIPIIMLTSHVLEMDEAMCLAAGADDYMLCASPPKFVISLQRNRLSVQRSPLGL
jgi:DNA-binding response OmpR family regulator